MPSARCYYVDTAQQASRREYDEDEEDSSSSFPSIQNRSHDVESQREEPCPAAALYRKEIARPHGNPSDITLTTSHSTKVKSRDSRARLHETTQRHSAHEQALMEEPAVANGTHTPQTPPPNPRHTQLALTEYAINPSPPCGTPREKIENAGVPEGYILPTGYPDVSLPFVSRLYSLLIKSSIFALSSPPKYTTSWRPRP